MIELEGRLRVHPDDWRSWLVYADWLTEQGDERGELVVLRHKLEKALSLPERERLQRRVDELVLDHQAQWLGGLSPRSFPELRWRYGFVLAVVLPAEAGAPGLLEELARSPAGRLLSEVTFSAWPAGSELAVRLADSEIVHNLLRLELSHQEIDSRGAIALARSKGLGALVRLGLAHNAIGDRGAKALSRARSLRPEAELDLHDNPIGPKGWAALAHARSLPHPAP